LPDSPLTLPLIPVDVHVVPLMVQDSLPVGEDPPVKLDEHVVVCKPYVIVVGEQLTLKVGVALPCTTRDTDAVA